MARRGTVSKQVAKDRDTRPIRWRRYPYLFLIVCEDEKTEPYYFGQFIKLFPEETVFLRTVGTGRSSKGVVEQSVIERAKLLVEANKDVDEVWAVFDKDDAEKSVGNKLRFNEAFKLAQDEKIKVAYSNEVFELWILLHFVNVSSENPIPRTEIYTRIETAIKAIIGKRRPFLSRLFPKITNIATIAVQPPCMNAVPNPLTIQVRIDASGIALR